MRDIIQLRIRTTLQMFNRIILPHLTSSETQMHLREKVKK